METEAILASARVGDYAVVNGSKWVKNGEYEIIEIIEIDKNLSTYYTLKVRKNKDTELWIRNENIESIIMKHPAPKQEVTTLPENSASRKEFPIYEGVVKYFPAALAGVAQVSKLGNDKHNPGQPLHHSRGKSADHADCILRHLVDMEENRGTGKGRDENGVPQVYYIAWRALALAQEWAEKHDGKPIAPGAREEVSEL